MQIFPSGRCLTVSVRLLAMAFILRSFIAPGFMLSSSADGLGMVFCNGPAAVHVQDNRRPGHHHGDSGKNDHLSHVTAEK